MTQGELDKLIIECKNQAVTTWGMSFIFERRGRKLKRWIIFYKILGIAIPVLVGGIVLGYGEGSNVLNLAVTIAIPLVIIQLLMSVFSLVKNWEGEMAYCHEAANEFTALCNEYRSLERTTLADSSQLLNEINILQTKYQGRTAQNRGRDIKPSEARMGMRAALREFQRACLGCKKTPLNVDSTKCDVCGYFSFYYKYLKVKR